MGLAHMSRPGTKHPRVHIWIARTVMVGGATALLMGASGCSSAPKVIPGDSETTPIETDVAFRDQVLADGLVSREEMEQAYSNIAKCFKDGGLQGQVWYDLELRNGLGSDLRMADESIDVDTAGDMILEIANRCENLYAEVTNAYGESHPESDRANLRVATALSCVEMTAPNVYSDLSSGREWDWDSLYTWIWSESEMEKYSSDEQWNARECSNFFGRPWRDLDQF